MQIQKFKVRFLPADLNNEIGIIRAKVISIRSDPRMGFKSFDDIKSLTNESDYSAKKLINDHLIKDRRTQSKTFSSTQSSYCAYKSNCG